MWERGLKHHNLVNAVGALLVAPHVGAWIETDSPSQGLTSALSLPMWERGLKQGEIRDVEKDGGSLPMWERGLKHHVNLTLACGIESLPMWERGLKRPRHYHYRQDQRSLPMWERGLKHYPYLYRIMKKKSRSPCGSVD